MNIFQDDLARGRRQLFGEKRKAKLLRLLTLGIVNPKEGILLAEKELATIQVNADRYDELLIEAKGLDDELLMVVEIEGVRVSKNTFADCPRLGAEGYPDDWQQLRKMVLARDNCRCSESCLECRGPLQIHHIVSLSKGGTNEMSNLITLCFLHHCLKHPHMKETYYGNLRS